LGGHDRVAHGQIRKEQRRIHCTMVSSIPRAQLLSSEYPSEKVISDRRGRSTGRVEFHMMGQPQPSANRHQGIIDPHR
jgi:hypothetical protein